MVYLIHFEKAYKHARHYIGYTEDVERRMADHASGQGARIMRIVKDAGIPWCLVRLWPGDRAKEKSLKGWPGGSKTLCPICNPAGETYRQRKKKKDPKVPEVKK